MAGTSDAVQIIGNLAKHEDIELIATTTTKYGGDLAISADLPTPQSKSKDTTS